MATYLRLRFTLTSDSEDRLTAELWSLGTLGLESVSTADGGRQQILAYFEEPLQPDVRDRLESRLEWPDARLDSVEPLPAADWLAEVRQRARPVKVGGRFLVDSREPEAALEVNPSDRVLLRIPARAAFGTGSHESTQLAVELMEGLPMEGLRVLDVGTGTGILAFAALALGAGEVVGLDIDAAAVLLALENCRLNRWSPRLVAGTVECLRAAPRFDLALINVLPDRIRNDLGPISVLLPRGARAVVSGLLVEQREPYLRELAGFGLMEKQSRRSGEWMGCLMEKAG